MNLSLTVMVFMLWEGGREGVTHYIVRYYDLDDPTHNPRGARPRPYDEPGLRSLAPMLLSFGFARFPMFPVVCLSFPPLSFVFLCLLSVSSVLLRVPRFSCVLPAFVGCFLVFPSFPAFSLFPSFSSTPHPTLTPHRGDTRLRP